MRGLRSPSLLLLAPIFGIALATVARAEPPQPLLDQFARLNRLARSKPAAFDARFLEDLDRAEALLKKGELTSARGLLNRALQRNACLLSGGKDAFELPSEGPASGAARSAAVQKSVAELLRLSKERFLDSIVQQAALEKWDRTSLARKPQPPASAAQIRLDAQRARDAILQPDALAPTTQDTPAQTRQLRDSRAERLRIVDEAEAKSLKDLPTRQKRYPSDLAAWKKERTWKAEGAQGRILSQTRVELLKDPEIRQTWEKLKANDSGLERISVAFDKLAQAAARDPGVAAALARAQPVLASLQSWARQWTENKLEYPEQTRRAREHGLAFQAIADRILSDARSTGKVQNVGVYSVPDMARILTDYQIDRNDQEIRELAWLGADAIAAAGLGIASLGITGPGAALALQSLGLLESGASLAHHAQAKNPDKSLAQQFQDPEIALHAALFLSALPLGSAQKLAQSPKLVRISQEFFKDAAKARRFVEAARKLASLVEKGQYSYFTVRGLEGVAQATQACAAGQPKQCSSTLGLALLQLIPQGVDVYRATRAPSCRALAARDAEPVPCKPGETRTSPRILGLQDLQEDTRKVLQALEAAQSRNRAQGRSNPDRQEVELARQVRDSLLAEARKYGNTSTLIDAAGRLEKQYHLRDADVDPSQASRFGEIRNQLHNAAYDLDHLDKKVFQSDPLVYLLEGGDPLNLIRAPATLIRSHLQIQTLRSQVAPALKEHLNQKGIAFKPAEDGVQVIDTEKGDSLMNRFARAMMERYGVRVGFDPKMMATQPKLAAGYDSAKKLIYLSSEAIVTGRPDEAVGHEVVHALLMDGETQGRNSRTAGYVEAQKNRTILPEDPSPNFYGRYYHQQEYAAWGYSIRNVLAQMQNPRATTLEQANAQSMLGMGIGLLDKISRADERTFADALHVVESIDPNVIDSKLGHRLAPDVRMGHDKTGHRPYMIQIQTESTYASLPGTAEIKALKEKAVDASSRYSQLKKDSSTPMNELESARRDLVAARTLLKAAVIVQLKDRIAFAREIQDRVLEASQGYLKRKRSGELVVDPEGEVTKLLNASLGRKLPDALIQRLLAPGATVRQRTRERNGEAGVP